MKIEEYFSYREELLDQSKDEEGFTDQSLFLSEVLPSLLDAKLVDSEDINEAYFLQPSEKLKVNAYCVNESGERLQLFIVNEDSIDLRSEDSEVQISTKGYYETHFKRATRFVNKAYKGHLNEEVQDSHPAKALIHQLSSSAGAEQFDVIEIFLISATATISLSGKTPQPKRIDFANESLKISYTKKNKKESKELLIKKRLIDLNFLYEVLVSQGKHEPLTVDFENNFGQPLLSINAASEDHFESYLCVLPAEVIAELYRQESTRLLEKNVRSFLQFRGVNKGIRETIRKEPEKFIAYNNGLTITATSGEVFQNDGAFYIRSLTDFQIVNGGQTTATIYFTKKDGFDISKVKVMAKINVAKHASDDELETLISNISTFSNAQSRVSKVDLNSRSPQLVKLKSLSESVLTPSGYKWFFERAKGEFNTKLRMSGSNKKRLKKEFPNQRRFSKEQLAKYYCAWGNAPYLVKKGGEKVFRHFINEISDEDQKSVSEINRSFYEEIIAKIILFRSLEKIYGQGKNSMGQIRSAAIPYALSVLYTFTDGKKDGRPFDLEKIWKSEGLENDLREFFRSLLLLVNELIKKYSLSDDYGEYSKKPELWNSIQNSSEVKDFMSSEISEDILNRYMISEEELLKRHKAKSKAIEVDFKTISDIVALHVNGVDFYEQISSELEENLQPSDKNKLNRLISIISNHEEADIELLEFEKELIQKLRKEKPELLTETRKTSFLYYDTLEYIIRIYSQHSHDVKEMTDEFEKVQQSATLKKVKYASIYSEINKRLQSGKAPTFQQIYYASYLFREKEPVQSTNNKTVEDTNISVMLIRKMVEWDIRHRKLTEKERQYLADLAYGLKNLNSFHEKNTRKHLERLINSGFNV